MQEIQQKPDYRQIIGCLYRPGRFAYDLLRLSAFKGERTDNMFDNRIDYMEETSKQIRESAETFRRFERADWKEVKDWDVSLGLDSNSGCLKWQIDFFDSHGAWSGVSFEGPPDADDKWYREEIGRQLGDN
jgi:hypothetical protein